MLIADFRIINKDVTFLQLIFSLQRGTKFIFARSDSLCFRDLYSDLSMF